MIKIFTLGQRGIELKENSESDISGDIYLQLDPSCIDTNIVTSIRYASKINGIIVDIDNCLISTSFHKEAFSEKTIKPLKRDLAQILKGNKKKQEIINSIVTCILSNIDRIQSKVDPTPDKTHKGFEGSSNARTLVELASQIGNAERFFKDQYGRPFVAVRLGKYKHMAIMPLKSSKYKHYLSKLYRESTEGENYR